MSLSPFDRYLQPSATDDQSGSEATPPSTGNPYYDDRQPRDQQRDQHGQYQGASTSGSVQFQMPTFMYSGPPQLAHGGGAEVLSAGLFNNSGGIGSSWLANNGFGSSAFSSGSNSAQNNSTLQPMPSLDDYLRRDSTNSSAGPSTLQTSALSYANMADPSSASPWATSPVSPIAPTFHTPSILNAPSTLGLPVYSASGFDILSLLGRVAVRQNPKIQLGPVDLTCSFVVTDVRRYDNPIVYVSPNFTQLTGYEEAEIIGRNCRFLQSPDGRVHKGEERRYTAGEAVNLLRKGLTADKEVQVTLINYKKGGEAFINLVTVIPLRGGVNNTPAEADEVVYHVGFQVDLTKQPNAILQRLKDGSYIVDYATTPLSPSVGRRGPSAPALHAPMSAELRTLLSSQAFIRSLPLNTKTNAVLSSDKPDSYDDQQLLDMLLLEALPDFVHVLSLKGVFLYVAPSVRRVLGYAPEELVGKSVADICHPADLVPLMRELKEASAPPPSPGGENGVSSGVVTGVQSIQAALSAGAPSQGSPRTVDLLFRAKHKDGTDVWLDCRGRLHVEPGKGRKAIIMSGRQRGTPRLRWGAIGRAGGLAAAVSPLPSAPETTLGEEAHAPPTAAKEQEFWAELSPTGTVLFASGAARDVLGWGAGELIGRTLVDLLTIPNERARLERALRHGGADVMNSGDAEALTCEINGKDGRRVPTQIVLYRSEPDAASQATAGPSSLSSSASVPVPVIVQIKMLEGGNPPTGNLLVHEQVANVFEELETARGTSWQFELQQLKYANRRLADEVASLETGESGSESPPPTGSAKKRSWDESNQDEEPS